MRIGEEGQITIPPNLMQRYNLHKYDVIEFLPDDEGVSLRHHRHSREFHDLCRMRGIVTLRGASSVDAYIQEVRGK